MDRSSLLFGHLSVIAIIWLTTTMLLKIADRDLKRANCAYKDAATNLVLVSSVEEICEMECEMKRSEFALEMARENLVSIMHEFDSVNVK